MPADFASEKNYSIGAMALTWVKESSGGGVTTRYTLSYDSNGGMQYKDERYVRNTVVQLDKVPTREGYTFTGWYADKELTQAITEIKMTSNKTVYAGWEETDVPGMLNGEDHYAYVVGYEDGTVRPGGNISRAEVATIFFRLLQDQVRQENLTTDSAFADVGAGDWYNTAISTMAELGILRAGPRIPSSPMPLSPGRNSRPSAPGLTPGRTRTAPPSPIWRATGPRRKWNGRCPWAGLWAMRTTPSGRTRPSPGLRR